MVLKFLLYTTAVLLCIDTISAYTVDVRYVDEKGIRSYLGPIKKDECLIRTRTHTCYCFKADDFGNYVLTPVDFENCQNERKKRESGMLSGRDPVVEKARAGHNAVIQELKEKFAGLKEGCYPRVKGCLCVIGKDRDGRDITERRMKDADCKCKPGERGKGCPAA